MYHINFCTSEMHKHGRCTDLIEITANGLGDDVVALMLVAVQRDNLELSMKRAIIRYVRMFTGTRKRIVYRRYRARDKSEEGTEEVIRTCIQAFPSLWVSYNTRF